MKKFVLLAVVGGLLAGCQSERVAFQFQPASAVAVVAPQVAPAPATPVADTLALASAPRVAATRPAHPRRSVGRASLPPLPAGLRPAALADSRVAQLLKPRLLPRLALRPHATEGAAENGLENIGFFALAVLLGLIAGLAALVSLIPGVTFWAGVGYVVAGLVVAFLLFKLFHKPAANGHSNRKAG